MTIILLLYCTKLLYDLVPAYIPDIPTSLQDIHQAPLLKSQGLFVKEAGKQELELGGKVVSWNLKKKIYSR